MRIPLLCLSLLVLAAPRARAVEDDTSADFARALELAAIVQGSPCPSRLLGSPRYALAGAAITCDTLVAAALVSTALESDGRGADAAVAVSALIDHALRAEVQRPFRAAGTSQVLGRSVSRSVVYRGLVLLMLAGLERLETGNAYSPLFDALAEELAQDLGRSPTGWLPTYRSAIWPSDHAPAAAALLLHRELRDPEGAPGRAGVALRDRLLGLLERRLGFPTQLDRRGRAVQPRPRGTVLAFTAATLSLGDPAAGAAFAAAFADGFCAQLGELAACREWPRAIERPADAVSGPIVAGYGVGACALGLAAARAGNRDALWRGLRQSAALAGVDRYTSQPRRYPLESAIELWGRSLRTWSRHAAAGGAR